MQARRDAERIDMAQHQRVAIRGRLGHLRRGDQAGCAGFVIHHDRHAPQRAKLVGDDPGDHIRSAARGKPDHDAYRAFGQHGIGGKRGQSARGSQGGKGAGESASVHDGCLRIFMFLVPCCGSMHAAQDVVVHLPYFATCFSSKPKPSPGVWCSTTRPSLCPSCRSIRRRKFSTWSSQKNST